MKSGPPLAETDEERDEPEATLPLRRTIPGLPEIEESTPEHSNAEAPGEDQGTATDVDVP